MEKIKQKISQLQKMFEKEKFLTPISLILTPFIIFFVTSLELYLKNKTELNERLIVLLPFFCAFILAIAIGYGIYFYYKKYNFLKFFLLIYFLSGPAFLVYLYLSQIKIDNLLKITVFLLVFIAVLEYLYRKSKIEKVIKIFAWLSVLLVIGELFVIFNQKEAVKTKNQEDNKKQEIVAKENFTEKKLPNVYHLIFDEYQTDMFDLTMNQETKNNLGGFVYYPNNATIYGRTCMSLASIFSGSSYDYQIPQTEYEMQAFSSDKSMLFWLKKSGYETNAYIHKVYTFNLDLFDSVVQHKENSFTKIDNFTYTKLFFNLWVYANFPQKIVEKVISPEVISQLKAQNTMSEEAPIVSQESFKSIITDKELLNNSNQYLFLHFILPHFPYVLKSDCSYDEKLKTSPQEQSKCATKMIVDFLNTLRELGRYDNSLIIIQGDHGARFKIENNKLTEIENGFFSEEWSLARSRSTLLIKTPEKKSTDSLVVSDAESSTLDIAPTIIDALGIEADFKPEGVSLIDPESSFLKRQRYYHFFEKKGKNETTDNLSRYIVKDGKIKFEKDIPLKMEKNKK